MYAVRRHLQMTPDEWDALPWYTAKMYHEGLLAEFNREASPGPTSSGGPVPVDGLTPGEFSTQGFRERNL